MQLVNTSAISVAPFPSSPLLTSGGANLTASQSSDTKLSPIAT